MLCDSCDTLHWRRGFFPNPHGHSHSHSHSLQPLAAFDPHGVQNSLAQRWEKGIRSFELFSIATGCKDDKQKRHLFLHTPGNEVHDIFFTLTATGDDYKTAKEKSDEYFSPRTNTSFNYHTFRKEKQKEGESVSQFTTRLRQLEALCDFPAESIDDFIRDQITDNCISQKLRTKLLAVPDLTLARTLELAQAMEPSEGQSRQISSDNNYASVYLVKQTDPGRPKKSQTSSTQCSRCGIKGHTSHECRCSRNVTCHKCHRVDHFASVCRSQSTADRKQHGSSFNSRDSRRFPGKRSNLCYVGDLAEDVYWWWWWLLHWWIRVCTWWLL